MGIHIAPSILNSDLSDLRGELAKIASADWAHIDVMDNHFVPNLTWGLPVVEAILPHSPVPLDVHLMIEEPDRWAPGYAEVGAQSVTFHLEAAQAPIRLARELRRLGARVGVALRPATPLEQVTALLGEIDLLLLMTVEPGFGGQSFLEQTLPKIATARAAVSAGELDVRIQIDGGVNDQTIARAAEAGADTFVAGSAVYRAEDAAASIAQLRRLAEAAHRH